MLSKCIRQLIGVVFVVAPPALVFWLSPRGLGSIFCVVFLDRREGEVLRNVCGGGKCCVGACVRTPG